MIGEQPDSLSALAGAAVGADGVGGDVVEQVRRRFERHRMLSLSAQ
jgi:hypothetical protein